MEKKYLIFLRPNLKNLSKAELSNIAENSLIREIIKKKELDRIFKDEENLTDIIRRRATLEDVFLNLTGRQLRD